MAIGIWSAPARRWRLTRRRRNEAGTDEPPDRKRPYLKAASTLPHRVVRQTEPAKPGARVLVEMRLTMEQFQAKFPFVIDRPVINRPGGAQRADRVAVLSGSIQMGEDVLARPGASHLA